MSASAAAVAHWRAAYIERLVSVHGATERDAGEHFESLLGPWVDYLDDPVRVADEEAALFGFEWNDWTPDQVERARVLKCYPSDGRRRRVGVHVQRYEVARAAKFQADRVLDRLPRVERSEADQLDLFTGSPRAREVIWHGAIVPLEDVRCEWEAIRLACFREEQRCHPGGRVG